MQLVPPGQAATRGYPLSPRLSMRSLHSQTSNPAPCLRSHSCRSR